MTEWTVGLTHMGHASLANGLDQDKLTSLRLIEELGLPTCRQVITPVESLLLKPDEHFDTLDIPSYFTILAPNRPNLLRMRRPYLRRNEVIDFIGEALAPELLKEYTVILQESFPHYFGGNIVCHPSGAVLLEMRSGPGGHNEVVGGQTPEYTAARDLFTGRFQYSFDDVALRQAVWNTIMSIPHTTDTDHADEYQARGVQFHPGYYEFQLDRRTEDAPLQPIFIDYTAQQAFQAPV